MTYLMKQKLFSWGDDFTIKDDSGQDRFFVDGKAFSLGNQLLATVTKELFTFFKCTFTVDVPGPNDLQAQGDFLDHQYVFTRNGSQVAEVSKQWFTLADTYGVQISQDEDDVLILASTVVIDMACHGDSKR